MALSDRLPRGVRRLFRLPSNYDRRMRDLEDEIRFHLDAEMAKLRQAGLSEGDARTIAEQRFGDTRDLRAYASVAAAKRESRNRVRQWIDELIRDLQWAARQIVRTPAFSASVVLILALGVGVNTAVFSVVHYMLISPLPYADGNRMVTIRSTNRGGMLAATPPAVLANWRTQTKTVSDIVPVRSARVVLGDSASGPPEMLRGTLVSPAMAEFLNERPLLGRLIAVQDTMAGAPPVAVLGESVWRRSFGESPDIIGRRIKLNGTIHTVVGVVSDRYRIPFFSGTVLLPLQRAGDPRTDLLGKLRKGVSIDEANREMALMFPAKSEVNPYDAPPKLLRSIDTVAGPQKRIVLALFGGVSIILLIAAANVGNLLLARSSSRQREFAVRIAIGAGRSRVIRQVLTECALLAFLASVLALVVAFLTIKGLAAISPGALADTRLRPTVLFWNLAIAQISGIVFGLIPALTAVNANVGESLKAGTRSATNTGLARRARTGLVVAEMGLSVVLLTGTGLLVRTLIAIRHADVGFQPRGLVNVPVDFTGAPVYRDAISRVGGLRAILDGVRAIPGVQGATYAMTSPPAFAFGGFGLTVDATRAADEPLMTITYTRVTPEYFALVGVRVRQGRTFSPVTPSDTAGANDEIIINESLARRLWPNGDALGARVRRTDGPSATVVGIAEDVRRAGEEALTLESQNLQVYLPAPSAPLSTVLLLRTDLPVSSIRTAVGQVTRNINSGIRTSSTHTPEEEIAAAGMVQRMMLELIGGLAVLAIVLSAIGLHAVIAHSVSQRVREIGVRVALGATGDDVMQLILRQGLRLALAGSLIGMVAALGATRILAAFLYGVTPSDPLTLAIVATGLLGVALLATYVPARRAARLDPVAALRTD